MLIRYPKPPAGKPAALSYLETTHVDKSEIDTDINAEVMKEMEALGRPLAQKIIPLIENERLDVVAMVLAMLLGQNIAMVVSSLKDPVPLETLVDRITLSVRTNAQVMLDQANDTESHREH